MCSPGVAECEAARLAGCLNGEAARLLRRVGAPAPGASHPRPSSSNTGPGTYTYADRWSAADQSTVQVVAALFDLCAVETALAQVLKCERSPSHIGRAETRVAVTPVPNGSIVVGASVAHRTIRIEIRHPRPVGVHPLPFRARSRDGNVQDMIGIRPIAWASCRTNSRRPQGPKAEIKSPTRTRSPLGFSSRTSAPYA